MEHDPESMMEPGTAPTVSDAAAGTPLEAIGYEAADPSLCCAPYWRDVLHVPCEKRDLR